MKAFRSAIHWFTNRYRVLLNAGKIQKVATTAIARELIGFIWAIVCEVKGKAMDLAA